MADVIEFGFHNGLDCTKPKIKKKNKKNATFVWNATECTNWTCGNFRITMCKKMVRWIPSKHSQYDIWNTYICTWAHIHTKLRTRANTHWLVALSYSFVLSHLSCPFAYDFVWNWWRAFYVMYIMHTYINIEPLFAYVCACLCVYYLQTHSHENGVYDMQHTTHISL